jgi:hypothetical protein
LIVHEPGLGSFGHFLHHADSKGSIGRLETVAALHESFLEITSIGLQQLLSVRRDSLRIERDLQLALLYMKPVYKQEQAAISRNSNLISFGGENLTCGQPRESGSSQSCLQKIPTVPFLSFRHGAPRHDVSLDPRSTEGGDRPISAE